MLLNFFLIISLFNFAHAKPVKISDCKISFKTIGQPVLVSIEGKSGTPCEGSLDLEEKDFKAAIITMELNQLDTGIPLRNKHLRENYLHTDKFPVSTLTELKPEDAAEQLAGTKKGSSTFTAMLEIHGQKKSIEGKYEVKDGNKFEGNFKIDLPNFGVNRPSFMGVKVVDKVQIFFKFKVDKL